MDNTPFYVSLGHRATFAAPTLAHNTLLTVGIALLFTTAILGL